MHRPARIFQLDRVGQRTDEMDAMSDMSEMDARDGGMANTILEAGRSRRKIANSLPPDIRPIPDLSLPNGSSPATKAIHLRPTRVPVSNKTRPANAAGRMSED